MKFVWRAAALNISAHRKKGKKNPLIMRGEDRDGVYGKENRVVTGYYLLPVLLLDNVSGESCCIFATSRSWLIRCWCLSCKTACCSGVSR